MARIPKTLLNLATEAGRRQAMQMFGSTPLGRAIRRLDQQKRRVGSAIDGIVRRLRQKQTQSLMRRLKASSVPRDRYTARKPGKNWLLQSLFKSLGPVGNVFKALMFPLKETGIRVARQLAASMNLLRAFNIAVIPEPDQPGQPDRDEQDVITDRMRQLGWTFQPPDAPEALQILAGSGPQPRTLRDNFDADTRRPRSNDPNRRPGRVRVGNRWVSDSDPMATGAMIHVSSSNVYSIGFDRDPNGAPAGTLKVTFRANAPSGSQSKPDAPGATYHYKNVPSEVFTAFQRAASKGAFVWDRLRERGTVSGKQYDFELAGISQDYVPRQATLRGDGHEWYLERTFVQGGQLLRSQLQDERVRRGGGRPNRGNNGRPNDGRPEPPNNGRPNDGRPRRG